MTSIILPPSSAQSTPGLEVPGAYPRELYPDHPTPTTRQRPSDLPQSISLPSTEKEGTHPGEHCGGVGSLPGSISETSVAKLPDERASEARASAPAARSKEITTDIERGDDPSEAIAAAVVPPASSHVAKVPGERAPSEGKATSESASKGLADYPDGPITADIDRGDDPSKAVVPPASSHIGKVPDERASSKGKATPESASRGFAADTQRSDDARREGATAATALTAASSGAPVVTHQVTNPFRKTDPQGPDAASEQVPAELDTEPKVSLSQS